jgi:Zn-dependent protease with chaperone function
MIVKRQMIFENISPKTWEHPADKAALAALKAVPGLDQLVRAVVGATGESSMRLLHLANSVRVSERQFPRVNALSRRAFETLDLEYRPEVFVTNSPFFNAGTYGVDKPFIVLNSSVVKGLDDLELLSVIGHELGHAASGHGLYKTLLYILVNASASMLNLGGLVLLPIIAALKEWDRMSELTADRAGLLAAQDEEASYRLLMKAAGGDDLGEMNVSEFFLQAEEYESKKDLGSSVNKLLNTLQASHPFPVIRLKEIRTWASGGDYAHILEGLYLRRDLHKADAQEEMRGGFNYYKESVEGSEDPLAKMAKAVVDGAGKVFGDAAQAFQQAKEKTEGARGDTSGGPSSGASRDSGSSGAKGAGSKGAPTDDGRPFRDVSPDKEE